MPLGKHQRGELGPVVGAEVRRRGAALGDQALQDRDGLVGVDRAGPLDRQRLAGELVDDVEELQLAAVGSRVVSEVSAQTWSGRSALSRSLTAVDSLRVIAEFSSLLITRIPHFGSA